MRITKCSVVLLLAVCLSYPALAAKAKEASGTYQASCIVKIDADPEVYPVCIEAFDSLMHSSGVIDKAGRDLLKNRWTTVASFLSIRSLDESPIIEGLSPTSANRKREIFSSRTMRMFELEVNLPGNDSAGEEPIAGEILAAAIANMKDVLKEIYIVQRNLQNGPLDRVEADFNDAYAKFKELTGVSPASGAIEKQLDMTVDVSKLGSDTPLYEAFDMLSKSIKPALPLTVMWKDLSDNAFIEKEEDVGIDGENMSAVRLGTALDLVLKSVGGNSTKLGYAIEGGILIVATREQLPLPVSVDPFLGGSLRNLEASKTRLMARKAQAELEIAEFEAYSRALTKQIAKISQDLKKKVEEDELSKQYLELIQLSKERLKSTRHLMDLGTASREDVDMAKKELIMAEISYKRRPEEISKQAGGDKISKLNDRLGDTEINISVNRSKFAVTIKQLNEVDAKLAAIAKHKSKRDKIEAAKKALATAEYKVKELEKQEANLTFPVVTVIGAN